MNADDLKKLVHFFFAFATDPSVRADVVKLIADIKAVLGHDSVTPPSA